MFVFFSRWRNSSESSSQKPCSGHHSVWPYWLLAGCKRDGEFRRQRYIYRNTQDFGPQSNMTLCFFLQSTILLMKWICTRCIQAVVVFFWFFLKYLIEHSWTPTSWMWLNERFIPDLMSSKLKNECVTASLHVRGSSSHCSDLFHSREVIHASGFFLMNKPGLVLKWWLCNHISKFVGYYFIS